MSDSSRSIKGSARASDGGFSPRSAAGGFFLSLRSMLRPAGSQSAPEKPAPVTLPASPLRLLSGMPQAPGTERSAPGLFPSAAAAHPLRRVAGSAGRWKARLSEAKQTWPQATVAELIATDGHVHKLTDLIQARYGLDREAAQKQVLGFLGARDGHP
ncbi:MAG: hypothetical protein U1E24_04330 [Phenylobacterium sp.]|nr:hypothetical protein [Phenylobacterium sp.]